MLVKFAWKLFYYWNKKSQKSQRIFPFLKSIQTIQTDFMGAEVLGFLSCSALVWVACSSWFFDGEHAKLQFILQKQNPSVINPVWEGKGGELKFLCAKEASINFGRLEKFLELIRWRDNIWNSLLTWNVERKADNNVQREKEEAKFCFRELGK